MEYEVNEEYTEKLLKKLNSEAIRIPDEEISAYNIDGCKCPPCVCQRSNLLLILSPIGIGVAGGIFLSTSPL